MAHHAVELTISFEGGTGVTRSVSPEEVRFETDVPLAAGQLIQGTLRSPDAEDGIVTRLRYSARVVGAWAWEDGVYRVEARFERLGFITPDAAGGGRPSGAEPEADAPYRSDPYPARARHFA